MAADDPLRALWTLSKEETRTKLGVEFMALANHRKAIRSSIARHVERFRALQAEALSGWLDRKLFDPKIFPPMVLSMIITAMSRVLITEQALGISLGHQEAESFMEWSLAQVGGRSKLLTPKPVAD